MLTCPIHSTHAFFFTKLKTLGLATLKILITIH